MGYVRRAISQFIPPTAIFSSAGTWTLVVNSNVWSKLRTAADAAFVVYIPILIPSSEIKMKGSHLESIEVMYEITTANADDFATVRLYLDDLKVSAASGDGTINSASLVATSLDNGHNSAAERKAQDEHRMVVTLDDPEWIDNDKAYHLELTVDAALTTNFYVYGAIINYIIRT
jgi:hypothetical protein